VGADSKIQWTHHTFNPTLGCAKVHTGCLNCYAENEQAIVMRKGGRINWGEVWQGGDRVVVADSTWAKPMAWARAAAKAGERHRVFCASLSDVLEVPALPKTWPSGWDEKQIAWATERVQRIGAEMERARERLWDTIRKTTCVAGHGPPGHVPSDLIRPFDLEHMGGLDWLLLTKRPEEWRRIPEDVRPLVWLGTSISDQATADEWAPRLLAAEGCRYRFLSVEPLVGPVDLRTIWRHGGFLKPLAGERIASSSSGPVVAQSFGTKIDWVICGGESGPKARSCNVEWIRSIVRQCREAGVPCHVKQLGAVPATSIEPTGNFRTSPDTGKRQLEMRTTTLPLTDPKGGDWDEWPEDLRVREFPTFTR
jgi:protein gp37